MIFMQRDTYKMGEDFGTEEVLTHKRGAGKQCFCGGFLSKPPDTPSAFTGT